MKLRTDAEKKVNRSWIAGKARAIGDSSKTYSPGIGPASGEQELLDLLDLLGL
jgi:hypothetical protein